MDKAEQRKLAKERRAGIEKQEREQAESAVLKLLMSVEAVEKAGVIMCYKALGTELDIHEAEHAFIRRGKCLCYPVSGENGIMKAYSPKDEKSWRQGKFGIIEPDPEKSLLIDPANIDVVICPALAFDGDKMRLGYGKGYYDRFLPQCSKALCVLPAFEVQRFVKLITDEHDRTMDFIVTEKGIF